ncbi:universal stress protein [Piscirickettsia salmonis]|uniref:universal stress protein n=1 Tax=Piscirickettsia salmonis TaxID=1238 RepID=UPI000F07C6B1|nr:universal stress protein [Piscirickettsiaceae bacterium NZ-RLO2]
MNGYQHFLFATNMSDACNKVIAKVRQFADVFEAKLSVVNFVEPVTMAYPGVIVVDDLETSRQQAAKEELVEFCKALNVSNTMQHVIIDTPKNGLFDLVESLGVDLVIIGRHNKMDFSWLLGSTTNAIIHAAHCDVLVLHE